jgi:probable rRNA maturation factor
MTDPFDIDVAVEDDRWSSLGEVEALVRRCITEAAPLSGTPVSEAAELSVLLSNDAAIQVLNRQWRGMDKPTNVLSFPAAPAPHGPRLLGDIAVAFETTRREAEAEGKTLEAHLAHLLVHGFLHLLHHDHDTDAAATAMEAVETRILARLGIADPYAGSEPLEAERP